MKRTKKKASSETPVSVKPVIVKPQQRTHITKPQIKQMLESANPPVLKHRYRLRELKERQAFYRLLEDDMIQNFLQSDPDYKVSDKYLLSMVLIYFRRMGLQPEEYNQEYFFMGLFIANIMEEDRYQCKFEILPYMLGPDWRARYFAAMRFRDYIWQRLDYRAWVQVEECDALMAKDPSYWAWKRERIPPDSKNTNIIVISDEESSPGYTPQSPPIVGSQPLAYGQYGPDEIIVISS